MQVETVFEYRTLIGKCELGIGLDWEDIDRVQAIEHQFRPLGKDGRKFRRDAVTLEGVMRGDRINDRVEIVELGPGGFVCCKAPFVARGEHVEIVIDDGDRSFRFRARGVWMKDDGDDYKVGLAFVGMPVCLHKVQVSKHEADLIDKIAAAA